MGFVFSLALRFSASRTPSTARVGRGGCEGVDCFVGLYSILVVPARGTCWFVLQSISSRSRGGLRVSLHLLLFARHWHVKHLLGCLSTSSYVCRVEVQPIRG